MAPRCAHGHTLWSSGMWVRTCLSPFWVWLSDCLAKCTRPKSWSGYRTFLTQEATSAIRRCATSSIPTSVASSLCTTASPAGAALLSVGKRLAATSYCVCFFNLHVSCGKAVPPWQGAAVQQHHVSAG